MQYIKSILKSLLPIVAAALVTGCSSGGVISESDMATIVKEMFLADQFVERNPDMRGQMDSLALYPAIIEKNGHTVEEFNASVSHYLQKDDSYAKILKRAQASMEEHVAKLDFEIRKRDKIRRGPTKWWALDSVRNMASEELLYNTLMRGVRWIVIPGEKLGKWALGDSAIVDIPQNPQWWYNTLNAPLKRRFSSYFYGDTETEDVKGTILMSADTTVAGEEDVVVVKRTPQEIQKERAEKLRRALMYGKEDGNIITEEVEEEEIELP